MKVALTKPVRLLLLGIACSLLIGSAGFLFKVVNTPVVVKKKIALEGYKQSSDIRYEVQFNPNPLYSKDYTSQVYLTEFVKAIKATFDYKFATKKPAQIEGQYEVLAVVEGYLNDEKVNKILWQKQFPLVPKTDIQTTDNNISINQLVSIEIGNYNAFANEVMKMAKFNSPANLSVFMKVNLRAQTEYGAVEEKMTPTLVIPLDTSFFEITKLQTGDKPGVIEENQKVQLPPNRQLIILYVGLMILAILGFVFLGFFTKTENNPLMKQLKILFKQHGDRMVALNSGVMLNISNIYQVKTVNDLVRIADELGKPIMYKDNPNPAEIYQFYVLDDQITYLFDLKVTLGVSESTSN